MYKSDILEALKRVHLVSGGTITRLIDNAQKGAEKIQASLSETAANNDTSLRNGSTRLQEAIAPLQQELAKTSPSGTAIEIHELGRRFDSELAQYPSLDPLLRPGRQALAALAGAFDVVLQKRGAPPAIVGLIAPAIELGTCYAHYAALIKMFSPDGLSEGEESASIALVGAEDLHTFAAYLTFVSRLADVAARTVAKIGAESGGAEILIQSIDSGSPIKIDLRGGAKELGLLLTMIRDVLRTPYLHWTTRGRLVQAIETLAEAKKLGIDSPEALAALNSAVVDTAMAYAASVRRDNVTVVVQGEVVAPRLQLPQILLEEQAPPPSGPMLPPPRD